MKYRKKPVVIDAFQWTGGLEYRVLKEDIDAYDDYEDAGDHTQQLVVLVDLSLGYTMLKQHPVSIQQCYVFSFRLYS